MFKEAVLLLLLALNSNNLKANDNIDNNFEMAADDINGDEDWWAGQDPEDGFEDANNGDFDNQNDFMIEDDKPSAKQDESSLPKLPFAKQEESPSLPEFPIVKQEESPSLPEFPIAKQEESPSLPEFPIVTQEESPALPESPIAKQEETPALPESPIAKQEETPALPESPIATQEEIPALPESPIATQEENSALPESPLATQEITNPLIEEGLMDLPKNIEESKNQVIQEDIKKNNYNTKAEKYNNNITETKNEYIDVDSFFNDTNHKIKKAYKNRKLKKDNRINTDTRVDQDSENYDRYSSRDRYYNRKKAEVSDFVYRDNYNKDNKHLPIKKPSIDYDALLINAVLSNNYFDVKTLLNYVDNVNKILDKDGNNILILAVRKQNIDLIRLISKSNIDFNKINNYGRNALHYSAISDNKEMVKLLMSLGINKHQYDNKGYLPYHYALYNHKFDNIDIMKYSKNIVTKKNKEGTDIFDYILSNSDIAILEYFINSGIDITKVNESGHNLLMLATYYFKNDIVNILLKSQLFDLSLEDDYGRNVYDLALESNNNFVIDLLYYYVSNRN